MTKEKVEETMAVQAVVEADEKVKAIKAEKAAKKAEKHAKRLEKHPKIGKAVNWVDDNKIPVGIGVLIGGPLGVAGVLGYQKLKLKFLTMSQRNFRLKVKLNIGDSSPIFFIQQLS